jgi:hypothetical protein
VRVREIDVWHVILCVGARERLVQCLGEWEFNIFLCAFVGR